MLAKMLATFLIAGCSLVLNSCTSASAEPSQDSVDHFWSWFKTNEDSLAKIDKPEDNPLLAQLSTELKSVDQNLVFEVGRTKNGNKKELAISADMKQHSFPAVEKLVKAAPALPHWEIVSFRQRMAPERLKDLTIKGRRYTDGKVVQNSPAIELNVSSLKFSLTKNEEGTASLVVYIKDYHDEQPLEDMAVILLQQSTGERDFVLKIGGINFAPMSDAPPEAKPVEELGAALDALIPVTPDGTH